MKKLLKTVFSIRVVTKYFPDYPYFLKNGYPLNFKKTGSKKHLFDVDYGR